MSGIGFSDLRSLGPDRQNICTGILYNEWANISFFLDVPAGQYNNTYYGNITIYVNSTQVEVEPLNRTWEGPEDLNGTTVLIERFIEIAWEGTPIDFDTVAAGRSANASDEESGWPSNITSSSLTNIFIELYLNGTEFSNTTTAVPDNPSFCFPSIGNCTFESENVTYSNATALVDWPDSILALDDIYSSPGGDFPNWGQLNFGNATAKNIWWNISVPGGMPAAAYEATVWAKAVDVGETP